MPDTVGYTTPTEFREIVSAVRERVVCERDVTISVHCHNDLGLAVANSLAALDAGARQIECTVNGIGERAGNAALEETGDGAARALRPPALRVAACGRRPSTRRASCSPRSSASASQPNKAVVGRNAFAHEAGIHQHGVLSNPLCYEIMTPESVGVPANSIVLGKHSGRHALSRRFEELGFTLDAPELEELTTVSQSSPTGRRTSTIRTCSRSCRRSSGASRAPRPGRLSRSSRGVQRLNFIKEDFGHLPGDCFMKPGAGGRFS